MASIQGGTSLAKSPFPLVGAPGATALRLILGTLILIMFSKLWQLRFTKEQQLPLLSYNVSLGGMNCLFCLSIQTVPLSIAMALEFTGPLVVALFSSRRPADFVWVVLVVLGPWFLLPLGQDVSYVDLTGCALALGAGACWAIYILNGRRAGAEYGSATVVIGSLIAVLIFVPIGAFQAGEAFWHWSVIPLGLVVAILPTALPYLLEVIALIRLSTRIFGTLMNMEPALATASGMIFLEETLTPIQLLVFGATIAVSVGSMLVVHEGNKIKELDIDQIYTSAWLCITVQIFSLLFLHVVFIYRVMQERIYSENSW